MKKDKIKAILALLIPTTAMVFCFMGPVVALRNLHDAYEAKSWPTTMGTVTQSNWTYARHSSHALHFQYNYTVDGHNFTGDRYVFHSTWAYGDREADLVVAKYPVGSSLTVYYSPQSPSQSVIVPGEISSDLRWTAYVTLPIGIIIFLFLAFIMWLIWCNRNMTPTQKAKVREKINALDNSFPADSPLNEIIKRAQKNLDDDRKNRS